MNVNKVFEAGHLTRDPQLSYTPSQTAVVEFGIATNRHWTGQDGTKHDEVCFVDMKAWGKTAETINKYFKKGNPIFVEGHLVTESWTSKDGKKMSKLRVIVDQFQFVGGNAAAPQKQDMTEASDMGPTDAETPFV